MSTCPALISWTILIIGFLQITGTVSNPVSLSGLRGDALGINEGGQGYAALPSSQHHTQLHDQTDAEHRQQAEHDPLAEQEPQEEQQGVPQEEQQGVPQEEQHGDSNEEPQEEAQGEQGEEIQDGLDRGTRHLVDPDRNISSVEHIYGTDVPEGLNIDEGSEIPSEQQQMGGNTEGMNPERTAVHHQILPEETGPHEEPEPGDHISFLPDHSGPFPGESEGSHGDESFPEDHIHTEPARIHDGPIVRPLPTESVPVDLPDENQHSGIEEQHGEGSRNTTDNENSTDIFSNNKVEMSSKSIFDEQNQTAAVTTKNPNADSSNSSAHDDKKLNESINSTVSPSSHSISPTPSITANISTLGTSLEYQASSETLDHTVAMDTVTVMESVVSTSSGVESSRTQTTRENLLTVTQLDSSVIDVQPSYSEQMTSLIDKSQYNIESSTGSGEKISTTTTNIPVTISPTQSVSSENHLYDSSVGIYMSGSQGYIDHIASSIMDQIHLSHSISPVSTVTHTNSPTIGSLPLASQGVVIHDNDGQQQTTTVENTGSSTNTSTIPGYYTNSSVTTTSIYPYTGDSSPTNSSIHEIHPQTSDRPLTESPGRSTSPSAHGVVTPPSSRSTSTAPKTTQYYSDVVTLFLTTKKANQSSTKMQEKTSRTTSITDRSQNVTSTLRSTLFSTTSATVGTVKNPSTSHKHIHVGTDLPSVFISIQLQMTLIEFCSQKQTFITELVKIVEDHQQIDIQQQQVVLLNIRPKMCEKLLEPFTDNDNIEEVKVELYFLDTDGKADEQMTKVVSEIIKQGFDEQSESRFKQKLMDVKLIHPNEFVSPVNGPNNPPTVPKPKLQTGITIVIVIASVGGFCCVCLLLLQIIIHHRQSGKRMKSYPGRSGLSNVPSMDSIALGVVPKSRPNSGFWNPGLELQNESSEPTNVLEYTALSNFTMDPDVQNKEFENLAMEMPKLSSVPVGAEDKNRFANVIPFPHSRIKLKKIPEEDNSDYINANYVSGYNHAYKTYIATQAPLRGTMSDFWRMVWEQQSRAILMLVPMQANGQPSCENYWPDTEGMDSCLQFGDITVVLKKKDVQQEYTMYVLQLKDIENNLIREIHHFWYTSWPKDGIPEPISLVKFILDTRPHFEDSGAPVVVHCSPGTGRTGTLIAIDICMRSFEDRRKVDILHCLHCMRGERAGAVQTKEQYRLIYSALHEYATIVTSPKVSISSTAGALHKML
ncbi:uncharacterized protein LOC117334543 [Pecten maximus]|uniref:uncharacterized protein LOC117334543 n=1 Tax=Pecten maximus TaxID=6579 RepID=UPI00145851A6|nr:uncharacterized protein LOC117334543 [Pecten maximus]XP_033750115.1 uncharacterized protein LOC117334543 [Pecten maximus]